MLSIVQNQIVTTIFWPIKCRSIWIIQTQFKKLSNVLNWKKEEVRNIRFTLSAFLREIWIFHYLLIVFIETEQSIFEIIHKRRLDRKLWLTWNSKLEHSLERITNDLWHAGIFQIFYLIAHSQKTNVDVGERAMIEFPGPKDESAAEKKLNSSPFVVVDTNWNSLLQRTIESRETTLPWWTVDTRI